MKKKSIALLSASILAASIGIAQAGVVDSKLVSGNNFLNDYSAEFVLRWDGSTYVPVVNEDVAVGDVFGGFIDIGAINGQSLDALGQQFTGLFLGEMTDVSSVYTASTGSPPAGGINYDAVDITFGAVGNAVWSAIYGIDLTTEGPVDLTGALSIFYEENANTVNLFTQDFSTVLSNVTNGDLVLATDLSGGAAFDGQALPLVPGVMVQPPALAGATKWGTYGLASPVLFEAFGGEITTDIFGTGNNITTSLAEFGVQDRTDFSFAYVPEPASIALLGIGLVGIGFGARRKQKA